MARRGRSVTRTRSPPWRSPRDRLEYHPRHGARGSWRGAGAGWYRSPFRLPGADSGRQIQLDVDGAMAYSAVWLNGHFVGGWPYGYTSYRLDLTPHLRFGGENLLVVRVDN